MLTEEIRNTARTLGETLRAGPSVQTYLQAQADCAADPEAAEIEKRLLAMYQELMSRQQHGETLQRSEIDVYNTLNSQVHQHRLVRERDAALALIKQTFADIADDLNLSLGTEFAALAQAGSV